MSVDTIPAPAEPAAEIEAPQRRHLWRRRRSGPPARPAWLLRLFIESFSIMLSILAALAVDNWRENTNNHRLAMQSLRIFQREIRQNLSRIEDVAPYHSGLRTVVAQARGGDGRDVDIRGIIEGLQPTVLLNTAWQTALATGALTHIDVETVSALSLTYSIQQRFVDDGRSALPRVAALGVVAAGATHNTIEQTYAYLNDLVTGEQQLRGVYEQALQIISQTLEAKTPNAMLPVVGSSSP